MNPVLERSFVNMNLNEQRKTISAICAESPMFDFSAVRLNERQLVDKSGHHVIDFASQDYLGLTFNDDVVNASISGTRDFGTVVAWCRLVGTVEVFNQVEQEIAELVGTEACSIFASTTLLNHGVIPALMGKDGVLFLEKSAHMTMYEGAKIARDSGSKLCNFNLNDLEQLEDLLIENQHISKKLICVDGVNSMTGDYTDLPRLDKLAKKYNALLYVDDAHGFGVVGEKPDVEYPYGKRGNGIVNYFGLDYENIVYIGCFSKAYGSFGSFICCSHNLRRYLISQATPHDLGGAGPASAMCAVLEGLKINASQGEFLRSKMSELTRMAIKGLTEIGFDTFNETGFPIISVKVGSGKDMIKASRVLYENHILLTLAPYPMVKKGSEAFRITITATNTSHDIAQLIKAFKELKNIGYSSSLLQRNNIQ